MRARRRATTVLLMGALACTEPAESAELARGDDPAPRARAASPSSAPLAVEAAVSKLDAAAPIDAAEANATAIAADAATLPEQTPPSLEAPADPLAPILPEGPAPGSPEADAELVELLDESTLTQEEFDQAFRKGAPSVDDDRLVFGPGDRTRERPVIVIGPVKVSGASVAGGRVADLAKASMAKLETCYMMALAKAPSTAGAVTLELRFDEEGAVEQARLGSASSLGGSLDQCLLSVAEGWSLAAAAGATASVPLTLSADRG